MADLKGLCMSCREIKDGKNRPTMQNMKDIEVEEKETKSGGKRYSAKGKCEKCGGKMFKFLSKDDAERLKSESDN